MSQGSIEEVLAHDSTVAALVKRDMQAIKEAEASKKESIVEEQLGHHEEKPDKDSSFGKLVVAEEVEVGHVSWAAGKFYVSLNPPLTNGTEIQLCSEAIPSRYIWRIPTLVLCRLVGRVLWNLHGIHVPSLVARSLGISIRCA